MQTEPGIVQAAAQPAAKAAPILALREVAKTFETGTTALNGLDLAVREGEFLSLLGPSGCGKSTVLRLIAGLDAPSAGQVVWRDGRPDPRGAAGAGGIGFVFQDPTLMPWASVAGNVRFPLRVRGVRRSEAARLVEDALARVGLASFAHAYPHQLSGGMRMRASIARALVTRPGLLLMDEPFAALDEIARFQLNDEIGELWRAFGWTVLFVTHSVFEAVYLSSRIVVMTRAPGRVFAEIGIDAPFPRGEAFRASADYHRLCREVSQTLRGAMSA